MRKLRRALRYTDPFVAPMLFFGLVFGGVFAGPVFGLLVLGGLTVARPFRGRLLARRAISPSRAIGRVPRRAF